MSEQELENIAGYNPETAEEVKLRSPGVATLLEVFARTWPHLHRLEFGTRVATAGETKAILAGFESFFSSNKAPLLRHLVLGGGTYDEGVLRRLIESPLLDQLESLDFSTERLSPQTRALLVRAQERFCNLILFPKADTLDDVRSLHGRALIARDLGLLERAVELLDRAIQVGGNHVHLSDKAALLLRLGRFDQALEALEQALAREPHDFPCWLRKIDVLSKLDRSDDALAAVKQARRRAYREEQRLQATAMGLAILREAGRSREMETEAIWALAEDDEEEPSGGELFWTGVIHTILNKPEAAMEKLAAAFSRDPKLKDKARQENLLHPLSTDPRFLALMDENPPSA